MDRVVKVAEFAHVIIYIVHYRLEIWKQRIDTNPLGKLKSIFIKVSNGSSEQCWFIHCQTFFSFKRSNSTNFDGNRLESYFVGNDLSLGEDINRIPLLISNIPNCPPTTVARPPARKYSRLLLLLKLEIPSITISLLTTITEINEFPDCNLLFFFFKQLFGQDPRATSWLQPIPFFKVL